MYLVVPSSSDQSVLSSDQLLCRFVVIKIIILRKYLRRVVVAKYKTASNDIRNRRAYTHYQYQPRVREPTPGAL